MKSVAIAALCFFAAVAAEADAEADAHYGYYGSPLVYSHGLGLPYAGYYGHHLGHFYGKRSADAEPAADADADAHYGAYGYGYPLVAHAPVVSTLHGLPYAGYYGHFYGKRSADAEPAADADAHYAAYGYPLVAAAPEADADAFYHHGYAHYGHGYALAHHGHHGYA